MDRRGHYQSVSSWVSGRSPPPKERVRLSPIPEKSLTVPNRITEDHHVVLKNCGKQNAVFSERVKAYPTFHTNAVLTSICPSSTHSLNPMITSKTLMSHYTSDHRTLYLHIISRFESDRRVFDSEVLWAEAMMAVILHEEDNYYRYHVSSGNFCDRKKSPLFYPVRLALVNYLFYQLCRAKDTQIPQVIDVLRGELVSAVYHDASSVLRHYNPSGAAYGGTHQLRQHFANAKESDDSLESRHVPPPTFIDLTSFESVVQKLRQESLVAQESQVSSHLTTPRSANTPLNRTQTAKSHNLHLMNFDGFVDVVNAAAGRGFANTQILCSLSGVVDVRLLAVSQGSLRLSNRTLVRQVFRAWRHVTVRSDKITHSARAWVQFTVGNVGNKLLLTYFSRWRRFSQFKHVYLRDVIVDLQKEIEMQKREIESLKRESSSRRVSAVFEKRTVADIPETISVSMTRDREPSTMDDFHEQHHNIKLPLSRQSSHKLVDSVDMIDFLEWWCCAAMSFSPSLGSFYRAPPSVSTEGSHRGVSDSGMQINFSTIRDGGLADGIVIAAIMSFLWPESGIDAFVVPFGSAHSSDIATLVPSSKRIEAVIFLAENEGFCSSVCGATDICNGSIATLCLIEFLFQKWLTSVMNDIERLDFSTTTHARSRSLLSAVVAKLLLSRDFTESFVALSSRVKHAVQVELMMRIRKLGAEKTVALADKIEFTQIRVCDFVSEVGSGVCAEKKDELSSPRASQFSGVDLTNEIACLIPVLHEHYEQLRTIFEYYRSQHSGPTTGNLLVMDIVRLIIDCRLHLEPGVSNANLIRILETASDENLNPRVSLGARKTALFGDLESTSPSQKSGTSVTASSSSNNFLQSIPNTLQFRSLSKSGFVQVLSRVALLIAVSSQNDNHGAVFLAVPGLLKRAWISMIQKNITPRAMVSAKTDFKRSCKDPRIVDIFSQSPTQKVISKLFRQYAAPQSSTIQPHKSMHALSFIQRGANSSNHTLFVTRGRFYQMLTDLSLIEKGDKRGGIFNIFDDAQNVEIADDEGALSEDSSGTLMDLAEFRDALVTIAVFKYPNPVIALHVRLQRFITEVLLPGAARIGLS